MASEPQVLIFGGPYSNSAALIALRRRARELAVPADRCFCTGDVVAYGGEPEETVDILRDWGCHVIAGNCEEQLAMGSPALRLRLSGWQHLRSALQRMVRLRQSANFAREPFLDGGFTEGSELF